MLIAVAVKDFGFDYQTVRQMPFRELMLIIESYNFMLEKAGKETEKKGKPLEIPNRQEFEMVLNAIKNRHNKKISQ